MAQVNFWPSWPSPDLDLTWTWTWAWQNTVESKIPLVFLCDNIQSSPPECDILHPPYFGSRSANIHTFIWSVQVCLEISIFIILAQIFKLLLQLYLCSLLGPLSALSQVSLFLTLTHQTFGAQKTVSCFFGGSPKVYEYTRIEAFYCLNQGHHNGLKSIPCNWDTLFFQI